MEAIDIDILELWIWYIYIHIWFRVCPVSQETPQNPTGVKYVFTIV